MGFLMDEPDGKVLQLVRNVDMAIWDYVDALADYPSPGIHEVAGILSHWLTVEVKDGLYMDLLVVLKGQEIDISVPDEPISWRGTLTGNYTLIDTPWEEVEVERPIAIIVAQYLYDLFEMGMST